MYKISFVKRRGIISLCRLNIIIAKATYLMFNDVFYFDSAMLISDSHQFVFVHIRKAAGTSLRHILQQVSLPRRNNIFYKLLSRNGYPVDYHKYCFRKHSSLKEAERSMPADKFNRYFKFAIVRNPWDRLVSEYEYIKTQPTHSRFKKIQAMNFADFVRYQSRRSAAYQVNALQSQDGQLGVDYVGKLETLDASLADISKRIGLSFAQLPHINRTERRDYRSYYNDKLAEQVADLWQDDIKTFDYNFKS